MKKQKIIIKKIKLLSKWKQQPKSEHEKKQKQKTVLNKLIS